MIALALTDGRIVWNRQITADDAYNGSCNRDHRSNCPYEAGPDYDFGSPAILLRARDGDRLLAGQKSGIVYALDATQKGEILWQTRVGEGGTNGGVQWGMATDGEYVYTTVSDVGRTRQDSNPLDTRRYVLDPQRGGGLRHCASRTAAACGTCRPRPAATARPPAAARRNPAP